MAEIYSETSPLNDLKYGHSTIGPAPTRVCAIQFKASRGIAVKADDYNTSIIYIGHQHVAHNGKAQGWPLQPGESITVPGEESTVLHAVSPDVDQVIHWIGL